MTIGPHLACRLRADLTHGEYPCGPVNSAGKAEFRFNFANSIKPASNSLPSLMPFVHDPFKVLLGHPASTMRERVEHMREGGARGIFTFTFVPEGQGDRGLACTTDQTWHPGDWHTRGKGRLIIRGDAVWSWRCK